MLQFHQIDRVALHWGPLKVYWYGIMYTIGFALAWRLGQYRAKYSQGKWTRQQVSDAVFYCGIGLILGGRIGYMLFYAYADLIANPISLFKIWEGGMSFHGGLLGGIAACWLLSRHHKKTFFQITDFAAPLVPLGLAAGRLGNFINGELWGRVTTMPWGMLYPHGGPLPRHPSQLYEFLLEGVLLFIIMWVYSAKPKPRRHVSGLFLLSYGCFRFSIEFFRQPDPQLGFVTLGWLTQGQLLCIPMILFGLACLLSTNQQRDK